MSIVPVVFLYHFYTAVCLLAREVRRTCHRMDIWTLKQIPLPYLLAFLLTVKPMYLLFQLMLDTQ